MSELVNARKTGTNFRWQLLATASAMALIAAAYEAGEAKADDNGGRSPVWIELGGQLSRLDDGQEAFAPDFPNSPARPSIFSPSQKFERLPLYSIDETGQISFEPTGTDWVLSASVRYGRASSNRHLRQQTTPKTFFVYYSYYGRRSRITAPPFAGRFADTRAQTGEQHAVLDFQAGKDVGLGIFGNGGNSVVSLGVRYAQFDERGRVGIKSQPTNLPSSYPFHKFYASFAGKRKFTGIGPSLSWDASATLIGNSAAGNITFDWGLNGAVLFGRQRTQIHHQTTNVYHYLSGGFAGKQKFTYQYSTSPGRNKETIVPNLGGFAGVSWRYPNAKVSIGYRADMFFGAIDGGIDAAHRESRGFYGPFASVSVGLGG